jgi:hypothetical protein
MEISDKRRFLEGLDDIALSLQYEEKIAQFEALHQTWQ